MEQRVILFIDHQNVYKCARETFFDKYTSHFTAGQFDPVAMAELLCTRAPDGFTRRVEQVRVYTGQPDGTKDSKGYGASRKQYQFWRDCGAEVIARPLRYPPNYPKDRPEEKGVDVKLAIDFIALAMDGAYDVGIIASTDTDLVPAIDFVVQRYSANRRAEVTAWTGSRRNPRLSSKLKPIWCHWLNRSDYDQIEDTTNYTL